MRTSAAAHRHCPRSRRSGFGFRREGKKKIQSRSFGETARGWSSAASVAPTWDVRRVAGDIGLSSGVASCRGPATTRAGWLSAAASLPRGCRRVAGVVGNRAPCRGPDKTGGEERAAARDQRPRHVTGRDRRARRHGTRPLTSRERLGACDAHECRCSPALPPLAALRFRILEREGKKKIQSRSFGETARGWSSAASVAPTWDVRRVAWDIGLSSGIAHHVEVWR